MLPIWFMQANRVRRKPFLLIQYNVCRMISLNKNTCFVIMPFSKTKKSHSEEYWTNIFRDFLKPLIEENSNLEARRSEPIREDILRQIIMDLVVSPVVVADLTDLNPNVLWELGVRQSFKHGTITIAESRTTLPFDISSKGTLFYDPVERDKYNFRIRFKKAIEDCLTNPDKPDSHVLETLYRGTLYEIFHRHHIIRRLDAVLSECDWNLGIISNISSRMISDETEEVTQDYPIRLGISTFELLVTDRYIEADDSFYNCAELCLLKLISLNNLLSSWKYPLPDITQRILIGIELAKRELELLKSKIMIEKERIVKQF